MLLARPAYGFRASLVFSVAIHALLLGWFWTHRPQVIEVSLPGTYAVDLVGGSTEPVAAPQEKLVSNPPVPLKRDEVVAPQKKVKAREKAPEPVRRPQPQAATAQPGPAAPAAPEARIGMSGAPGVVSNFPFSYYLISVRNSIARNWYEPQVTRRTRCTIAFRIRQDGAVEDVRVETPSGVPTFDQTAARAVVASSPLPRLPADFKSDQLGVHFDFEVAH
jgi:TonB family protein